MNLFNYGDFTLASGKKSNFKIDCDALTSEDWAAIAALVAPKLRFRTVIGIPRGGWKFAEALYQYRTPESSCILYADDVWTTGESLRKLVNKEYPMTAVVLFYRGTEPPPCWLTAVFNVNTVLL
jgi:orotate phosphoribosyltransferase